MKIFEKGAVFFFAYIIAMLPTYVLPYLGSNSSVVQGIGAAARSSGQDSGLIGPLFLVHAAFLLFLVYITWVKGSASNRSWIVIFPALATIFDLAPGLSLIPLVPTFMHVFAMIFGVRGTPEVAIVEAAKPE